MPSDNAPRILKEVPVKILHSVEGTSVMTDVILEDRDSVEVGNELVIAYDGGPGDVRLLFEGKPDAALRTLDRLIDALLQVRARVLARAART